MYLKVGCWAFFMMFVAAIQIFFDPSRAICWGRMQRWIIYSRMRSELIKIPSKSNGKLKLLFYGFFSLPLFFWSSGYEWSERHLWNRRNISFFHFLLWKLQASSKRANALGTLILLKILSYLPIACFLVIVIIRFYFANVKYLKLFLYSKY